MRLKYLAALAWFLVCPALLGGCNFIAMSGPSSVDVQIENSATLPFAVVKLESSALHVLDQYEPNVLAGAFADSRPPAQIRFGIGDVVSVTVFEASAGGLCAYKERNEWLRS